MQTHIFNSQVPVSFREDGYLNATAIAAHFGKQPRDYLKTEQTQEYIVALAEFLSTKTKILVEENQLVTVVNGGNSRGTWLHPKLAVHFARWQIDAHAFWRSSGDRQLTPDELAALPPDKLSRAFTDWTLKNVYDYETHVKIGEELEARGALPSSFMSLAPGSGDGMVWHDVNRMLTLNGQQKARNVQLHVCPLQTDIVDRLIERYSNPGELVYDPFCGLGTVPYRAVKMGRKGQGSELNPGYFLDSVQYLKAAEQEVQMPSLFDFMEAPAA